MCHTGSAIAQRKRCYTAFPVLHSIPFAMQLIIRLAMPEGFYENLSENRQITLFLLKKSYIIRYVDMEVDALTDKTIQFSIKEERDEEMRQVLRTVYDALGEKGYNPISQIVGYILSEDPTYITTHNNARSLIRKLDRDELLQALVRCYLDA